MIMTLLLMMSKVAGKKVLESLGYMQLSCLRSQTDPVLLL